MMVMPAFPGANLVIGQAGLAFGAFDTFLDTMRSFRDPGEFFKRRLGGSVGKIVIILRDASLVPAADD